MQDNKTLNYIKDVVTNMPKDWLNLTTHRLDIYNEELAKVQFLNELEALYVANNSTTAALSELHTAYDYIRLGHPLSCVLEWGIAKLQGLDTQNVISFDSNTVPILSILRKNLFDKKDTNIYYKGSLPSNFNEEVIKTVYGYNFNLKKISSTDEIEATNGSTVFIEEQKTIGAVTLNSNIDFYINLHGKLGSILVVNTTDNATAYVKDIQHVRRRETIAMTPANSLLTLNSLTTEAEYTYNEEDVKADKASVLASIKDITRASTKPLVASSGLSIQYAILMGLINDALENYKGKAIKIVVPPNCYGGTNDQARRVAACLPNVAIVDLPVDGDNDMVQSIHTVLDAIATEDAVPLIIAEIPTNPRVEVPNLLALKEALSKERKTPSGEVAIAPVFILDQTFCPNVHFLGEEDVLASVKTISFASGSKFPSGGKCTAGYCVVNSKAADLMANIETHLTLCDNEATALQYSILAEQLPSMNKRIADAYTNTRNFVNFIHQNLPGAKINFVSQELAAEGFTPSVFSLDLPTKGDTEEERETYKRALNLKLINLMITKIPNESKFCVSYGQLKGCYWTIPATSTQGTTKEGDKDYIVRASLSPNLDLDLHKKVFLEFVASI
ncbi:PLP-dependent aminotransferase family protein [Cellulophaga omnivescoria]|uniref:PLP-dependent transferase n=1 Tax=Cellulophaga omnivescoria TaxID=1888890 RepID=UPI0022F0A83F|nr:PLP-dependent transferase [Cellulophaga omnivescoria]WBU89224.1 PLP-dependent transferase [Cellulophaga omnivescoria]